MLDFSGNPDGKLLAKFMPRPPNVSLAIGAPGMYSDDLVASSSKDFAIRLRYPMSSFRVHGAIGVITHTKLAMQWVRTPTGATGLGFRTHIWYTDHRGKMTGCRNFQ